MIKTKKNLKLRRSGSEEILLRNDGGYRLLIILAIFGIYGGLFPKNALSWPSQPTLSVTVEGRNSLASIIISPTSVKLIWDDVPNAVGYSIYRDGKWIGQSRTGKFIDTKVVENKTYAYRVVYFDAQKVYGEVGKSSLETKRIGSKLVKEDYGAVSGDIEPCPFDGIDPADYGAFPNDDVADSSALNEAIVAATGSTLCMRRGVYHLDQNVHLISNINIIGSGTVLRPLTSSYNVSFVGNEKENITISNLTFDHILLNFTSSPRPKFYGNFERKTKNIVLDRLTFIDGKNYHIKTSRVENLTISRSFFKRSKNAVGRSVTLWKNANVTIKDSRWKGHLVSAINVNGSNLDQNSVIPDGQRSKNVTITNTSISRTPGNYAQDHGI
jgi:hypothetical protein